MGKLKTLIGKRVIAQAIESVQHDSRYYRAKYFDLSRRIFLGNGVNFYVPLYDFAVLCIRVRKDVGNRHIVHYTYEIDFDYFPRIFLYQKVGSTQQKLQMRETITDDFTGSDIDEARKSLAYRLFHLIDSAKNWVENIEVRPPPTNP
ncbi:hypothetical protein ACFL0Z_00005 [Patescibacteria group bacterium]